jgi:hypothetical protein
VTAIRFPVEAGHVLAFARAVGDDDLTAGVPAPGTPVPPTFPATATQFDPEHMRSMRPSGALAARSEQGGSVLHAEQHFEYLAPITVGAVLDVVESPGETWQKTNRRGGLLTFRELVREYRDESGALVARSRMVLVDTPP